MLTKKKSDCPYNSHMMNTWCWTLWSSVRFCVRMSITMNDTDGGYLNRSYHTQSATGRSDAYYAG